MSNKLMRAILGILCAAIFSLAACGDSSIDNPELSKPEAIAPDIVPKEELPEPPPAVQPPEPEKQQAEIPENRLPDPVEEEFSRDSAAVDVEWGQEIDLAEMIAKAKSGEIREIQWHVLPNILRAEAVDNQIFHLRNENKGVDLRNTLIREGVQIGNRGVTFRHVF